MAQSIIHGKLILLGNLCQMTNGIVYVHFGIPKVYLKMMAQLESLEQQKVLEPQKTPSDFNEFVVYPNPTSEVLNVRIPVTSGDKKQQQQYQIKVVNMMGAEVKSVVLNSGDSNLYQIEVSELQPSTYLILVSANNTIYSSKFVKQ